MIVTYKDLPEIRKKNKNKKIIFCSGTFDLPHFGHILFLKECKKLGDLLVVGVGNDSTIRRYKGRGRPILNEEIRIKTIDALKSVDYCFIDNPEKCGEKELFSPLKLIFEKLHPDIYTINNDVSNILLRQKIAGSKGVKLVILKKSFPISTSWIIEKIKKL